MFDYTYQSIPILVQNIANVNMQDVYYLETNLKGTDSVIIIAYDQLRNTNSYLISFLLDIVNIAVRWVSKTGYHNFENSSFILAVLLLPFVAPVFHDIYMYEGLNNWSKNFRRQWNFILNTCFPRGPSRKKGATQKNTPTLPDLRKD